MNCLVLLEIDEMMYQGYRTQCKCVFKGSDSGTDRIICLQ